MDPILIDPLSPCKSTASPLAITTQGYINGDQTSVNRLLGTTSGTSNYYTGTTNTYLDLVDVEMDDKPTNKQPRKFRVPPLETAFRKPTVPKWLASALMLPEEEFVVTPSSPTSSSSDDAYIPMRDLFTNPAVSFVYERGWRQGFKAAGFPGPDKEYKMIKSYFTEGSCTDGPVIVDMSCGSGLMTRRMAGDEDRWVGRLMACDFSDSMLKETRRRYENSLRRGGIKAVKSNQPRVDLVRVDVANLPFRDSSVDCLHAGAAMHCWPDVEGGLREIHRSIKPGGRYFASTFLAPYFRTVAGTKEGDLTTQNFQLFESAEVLKEMVEGAGFGEVEVTVEGRACAIIKARKIEMGEGGWGGVIEVEREVKSEAKKNVPSSLSPPNPPAFQ